MKRILSLTTLSAKLIMLLCVSFMGVFGFIQESFAQEVSPCHQEVVEEDTKGDECDMCEIALDTWEEDALEVVEIQVEDVLEVVFILPHVHDDFVVTTPLEGLYHAYYPPPEVLLKAVTPNTKTIVLLS